MLTLRRMGNIITGNGPISAEEFGKRIAQRLDEGLE